MANTRWFLLKEADALAAEAACRKRHGIARPSTNLSITWSVDHSKALIKVDGADKAWRDTQPWIANALKVLDRDSHAGWVNANFYTDEWQKPGKTL